jgi:hypothetical protein
MRAEQIESNSDISCLQREGDGRSSEGGQSQTHRPI